MIEVVLGEIVSPRKLYVQVASQYDMLNQLMDRLDEFYNSKAASSKFSLADCGVGEGDLLAVLWKDNMWYRGKVIDVKILLLWPYSTSTMVL